MDVQKPHKKDGYKTHKKYIVDLVDNQYCVMQFTKIMKQK